MRQRATRYAHQQIGKFPSCKIKFTAKGIWNARRNKHLANPFMAFKMWVERSKCLGKIAFFCHFKRGKQGIGNLGHRRNYDDRMPLDLGRNYVKNALKGGNVSYGRPAKFHNCRVQIFAHN